MNIYALAIIEFIFGLCLSGSFLTFLFTSSRSAKDTKEGRDNGNPKYYLFFTIFWLALIFGFFFGFNPYALQTAQSAWVVTAIVLGACIRSFSIALDIHSSK